jgi:hypothetical protein
MRLHAAGLSALLLASFCCGQALASDSIFPADLCQKLPDAPASAQLLALQNVPGWAAKLSTIQFKEMTLEIALEAIGKAADKKLSNLDVFSGEIAREKCAVEVPAKVLSALDASFDLHLVTSIAGNDNDEKPFHMISLIAWNGLLSMIYDRGDIAYHDKTNDRHFKFARVVKIETPEEGLFDNVSGLEVHVNLIGYLTVYQCKKIGPGQLRYKVGYLGVDSKSHPITRKPVKGLIGQISAPLQRNFSSPSLDQLKKWAPTPAPVIPSGY